MGMGRPGVTGTLTSSKKETGISSNIGRGSGSSSSSGSGSSSYTPAYQGTYFEDIFSDPANDYNARAYVPGSGWTAVVVKDGKTQTTGLPVGSIVETAGGAYRVTGVNPDGSYQSAKYTGKLPSTATDYSNGGSGGSGSGGSYGGGSYGGSAVSGSGSYGGGLPSASSQEDYLNQLYDAQEQAALAALEAAYQENVLELDATAAKIPGLYQTARNQTAGDAAVAQQNWNEYAAAAGLNSGTAGQAQLAMGNQLQAGLRSLSQAEADALASVETERAKAKTAYQTSVAQAIAQGDLARAEALYQEAVRVDESIVATALQNAQLAMDRAAYQYGIAQDNYAVREQAAAQQAENGWVMLNAGLMPSETQLTAMGLTAEQAAAILRAMA